MFDKIDVITAVFPKNIQIILTKFGYSPIKFLHLILGIEKVKLLWYNLNTKRRGTFYGY